MDEHPTIRTFLTAVTAFALSFGYFTAPLLGFMPADWLTAAGSAIGVGAAISWVAFMENWGRGWRWFGVALFGVGAILMVASIERGRAAAQANDRRCLAIQRDMLSARPRRSDGPDLFQALGCRPQGEGSVHVAQAPDPGRR